ITAFDPDNDPRDLVFTLDAATAWLTLVNALDASGQPTHVLSGTAPTSTGSATVTIRVDDGRGGSETQTYTLVVDTVVAADRPPTITSTPKFYAATSTLYQYTVTATD